MTARGRSFLCSSARSGPSLLAEALVIRDAELADVGNDYQGVYFILLVFILLCNHMHVATREHTFLSHVPSLSNTHVFSIRSEPGQSKACHTTPLLVERNINLSRTSRVASRYRVLRLCGDGGTLTTIASGLSSSIAGVFLDRMAVLLYYCRVLARRQIDTMRRSLLPI